LWDEARKKSGEAHKKAVEKHLTALATRHKNDGSLAGD
jgi:hypothetical protein